MKFLPFGPVIPRINSVTQVKFNNVLSTQLRTSWHKQQNIGNLNTLNISCTNSITFRFQQKRDFHHFGYILSGNKFLKSLAKLPSRNINIAGTENLKTKNGHFSKQRSAFAYLFVLVPIATFCLGTWQIYRRQWKLDLISKLESLMHSEPIPFPDKLEELNNMEYCKVKTTGYFDLSEQPLFIFPRTLVQNISEKKNKQQIPGGTGLFSSSNSRNVGAQLVLPFVVTEKGTGNSKNNQFRILVNLGWVSRETMEQINQAFKNQTTGNNILNEQIELVGVVRKTEKREPFQSKDDFKFGYWNRRDIVKMASKFNTAPIFLDAYNSYPITVLENISVNPIGNQTRVNLRNEHLSYIITWYSLTGILSFLWYKKIFKKRL